jgi:GTP-binding protein
VRHDGSHTNARITELLKTRALERYPAESAGPGDIVAIAGIEDITIGETIADPRTCGRCRPSRSTTRPSR